MPSQPTAEELQALLAAIVESSDDAIVSKSLDGTIRSWNKGAERIFGWKAEEAIGKPITILIPPDRLDEEPQILARIRAGERVDHFETIRQTKDGRQLFISVTVSPIRNAAGQVIGASKIARDITLQKQFQTELMAARDAADRARQAAEAARLAAVRAQEEAETANKAKDRFLSVLSHELRTPLTPVLGSISLLEKDETLPAPVAEQLNMVRRNVETEARLVDDLLDLTRIARGTVQLHFEVVDAHGMIRNVIGMVDPQINAKHLKLSQNFRAERAHVWADPGRFQQILLSLFSNAVKFTPEGGTITLCTSDEHDALKVEISDTGVGIEPEALPRIFKPFEQGEQLVTRQFGGLGVGLSIVKSLVELHKASITASSDGPDKGATFTLRVYAVNPGGSPPPVRETAAESAMVSRRILLVEDHSDTRRVLVKLLQAMGCQVTAAVSVKEAIAALEGGQFDLLLSDIGLPDGSGLDVMRFAAAHCTLKAIALSGFGQDEDLRKSAEAGFSRHLTKPVSFQILEEVIQRLGG
jgi:PAS domain S-box-containing protein